MSLANACGCGKGMHEMLESLNLDSAQKAKVKPVLEQLKTSMKDNAAQLQSLDIQIKQQATSDAMDQAAVDALIDKKTALIGNMIKAKISAKHQIFIVMNDKQKAELKKKLEKKEEKMAAKYKSCHNDD